MIENRPAISSSFVPKVALAMVGSVAVGALVAARVEVGASGWYGGLDRPPWALEAGNFHLLWVLFYALLGAALGIVWAHGAKNGREKRALVWLAALLVMAVAWNAVFFGLRAAGASYALAIVLWLCAAATLWLGSKISRAAGWLLVPCVLWITYVSSLNFAILSLNFLKPAVNQMDKDPRNGPANSKPGATLR